LTTQADPHALGNTKVLESLGGARDEAADLSIGVLLAHEGEARALGPLLDRIVEDRLDRRRRDLRMPVDVVRIRRLPRIGLRFRWPRSFQGRLPQADTCTNSAGDILNAGQDR
jgi:hypothetical protein